MSLDNEGRSLIYGWLLGGLLFLVVAAFTAFWIERWTGIGSRLLESAGFAP
jgi:hypothetical protein